MAITPEQTLQWGVLGMLGNTLPMVYLLHLELRIALGGYIGVPRHIE